MNVNEAARSFMTEYKKGKVTPSLSYVLGRELEKAKFRWTLAYNDRGWWYCPGHEDVLLAYPPGDPKRYIDALAFVARRILDTGV